MALFVHQSFQLCDAINFVVVVVVMVMVMVVLMGVVMVVLIMSVSVGMRMRMAVGMGMGSVVVRVLSRGRRQEEEGRHKSRYNQYDHSRSLHLFRHEDECFFIFLFLFGSDIFLRYFFVRRPQDTEGVENEIDLSRAGRSFARKEGGEEEEMNGAGGSEAIRRRGGGNGCCGRGRRAVCCSFVLNLVVVVLLTAAASSPWYATSSRHVPPTSGPLVTTTDRLLLWYWSGLSIHTTSTSASAPLVPTPTPNTTASIAATNSALVQAMTTMTTAANHMKAVASVSSAGWPVVFHEAGDGTSTSWETIGWDDRRYGLGAAKSIYSASNAMALVGLGFALLLALCLFYGVASCPGPRMTFHRHYTHCKSFISCLSALTFVFTCLAWGLFLYFPTALGNRCVRHPPLGGESTVRDQAESTSFVAPACRSPSSHVTCSSGAPRSATTTHPSYSRCVSSDTCSSVPSESIRATDPFSSWLAV